MSVGDGNHTLFDRIAVELAGAAAEPAVPVPHPRDRGRPERTDGTDESPTGIVIDGRTAWPAPDVSTQMARPVLADRQCSRSGCSDRAAVTLSYHYGQSQVWIDHLSPEREPHMYDMCDRHAHRLSVPQGWHLDDRRRVQRGALMAV